ncbi:hypothetical protein [Chitinimonas sp.]|uniref:hypothetical protein n=1 Tax=Chitinimonas sp. TaxID=1934313 RepID=UPI0035ADFD69
MTWASLALAMAGFSAWDFAQAQQLAAFSATLGWVFWAIAGFLMPVIPTVRLGLIAQASAAYAAGPHTLRIVSTIGGWACITAAIILKWLLPLS